MRKELELIQIIEKYLHNQLSPEDKIAFEEKLKTDTRLQKEVELQKDLIEGIKRIGIKQSIQKAGRKYKNGNKGYFLGSFLIVTVASLAGFNYLNNTGEYSDNLNIKQVEVVMDSLDQETVDFSVNNGNEELQTETDSLLDNTEIDKVQPIALQKKKFNILRSIHQKTRQLQEKKEPKSHSKQIHLMFLRIVLLRLN